MFNKEINLKNNKVIEKIKEYSENKVHKAYIRKNIKPIEASSRGKLVFLHALNSSGAKDYLSLNYKEVLNG